VTKVEISGSNFKHEASGAGRLAQMPPAMRESTRTEKIFRFGGRKSGEISIAKPHF
jgi:hypothetical protein